MKKISIFLSLAAMLFTVGCEESELLTFDTTYNYIQFTSIDYAEGSTGASAYGWVEDEMSFGLLPDIYEYDYEVDVEILGLAFDSPSEFKVTLVEGSSITTAVEGVHYKALEESYTFPAGVYTASFPITFYSTEEMDNDTFYLQIQIEEWGTNLPGIKTKITRTVSVSNKLSKPTWWTYSSGAVYELIGTYSQSVYECLLIALREEGMDVLEIDFDSYTYGEWYDVALILSKYIKENQPVDDNGDLITIKFPY